MYSSLYKLGSSFKDMISRKFELSPSDSHYVSTKLRFFQSSSIELLIFFFRLMIKVKTGVAFMPLWAFMVGSGSGSGRLGLDPDPDLNKWHYFNFFGVCKSHKYFRNLFFLTFLVMTIPVPYFLEHISKQNFQKKLGRKFIKVRIRICIRIRIRTFSKVGSGSGQKSSGSATLIKTSTLELKTAADSPSSPRASS
jgi:hypothetical protein